MIDNLEVEVFLEPQRLLNGARIEIFGNLFHACNFSDLALERE